MKPVLRKASAVSLAILAGVLGDGLSFWLAKALLWGVFLISALILWRVVPEVWKPCKAPFLEPWKSASSSAAL